MSMSETNNTVAQKITVSPKVIEAEIENEDLGIIINDTDTDCDYEDAFPDEISDDDNSYCPCTNTDTKPTELNVTELSKTPCHNIKITQNQYINRMLRIGRQNSIPEKEQSIFKDIFGTEYGTQNFVIDGSKVACAADCVEITSSTLKVFYVMCNYFVCHHKELNSEDFIGHYIYTTSPDVLRQKGYSFTLIRKRIAAQLQNLSKMALYVPANKCRVIDRNNKSQALVPYVIGKLKDVSLYDPKILEQPKQVAAIIAGFDFGDDFKKYLSGVNTYLEVPKALLGINAKHNPHAFGLILNSLIVADMKDRKEQHRCDITTDTLLKYCPNIILRGRRYRENIIVPIVRILTTCASPYFESYFFRTSHRGGKRIEIRIDDPNLLTYKQWKCCKLRITQIKYSREALNQYKENVSKNKRKRW